MDEKKHLLIVDDELLIRDLLYDHFTDRDYAISLADCGESALGLLDSREFDTVILDLKMPDMDGLELAAIIQKKQQTVPIIIITSACAIFDLVPLKILFIIFSLFIRLKFKILVVNCA